MNDELMKLADKFLELREKKSELDAQSKELSHQLDHIEKQMLQYMADLQMGNFSRNGVQYSVVTREYQKANEERIDELYQAMKTNGYENLFKINSSTLSATVNELIAGNDGKLPSWLEGLVEKTEKATIRMRK